MGSLNLLCVACPIHAQIQWTIHTLVSYSLYDTPIPFKCVGGGGGGVGGGGGGGGGIVNHALKILYKAHCRRLAPSFSFRMSVRMFLLSKA